MAIHNIKAYGGRRARMQAWMFCLAIIPGIACMPVQATGIEVETQLHLGTWSPFLNYWEALSPVCVWTESNDSIYRIIASNIDMGAGFQMTNETGNSVPYSVFWINNKQSRFGEKLSPGLPSTQAYQFSVGYGCGINVNTQIRVQVDKVDFDSALPGVYQGMLSLTLAPI